MRSLIVAALVAATSLGAQEGHRHVGTTAVIREVGAGAIGSFAGLVPVMLIPSCFESTHFNASIDCREPLVLGAFVVSPVGTSFGVYLAARHNGSKRSVVGAWLGGLAGGVAGIAAANALDRGGAGPAITFPAYYLIQSSMSVAGSRLLGRPQR